MPCPAKSDADGAAPLPALPQHLVIPLGRLVRWVKRASLVCLVAWAFLEAGAPDTVKDSLQTAVSVLVVARANYARRLAAKASDSAECINEEISTTTAVEAPEGDAAEHQQHLLQQILCFLCLCFLLSAFVDHCNLLVPFKWRVPFSVALCLTGMLTSAIAYNVLLPLHEQGTIQGIDLLTEGIVAATEIDPHIVFYVFLPPLLYESASSMSWHVLRKVLASSLLLALPGVMINIVLTGCLVKLITDPEIMTWGGSLLLASILSATDPVAVVAALHHLGAPKKISTLIEGESLLNDGSAVVFFFVFLDMVTPSAPDEMKQCPGDPTLGCVFLFFVKLAVGGVVLGLIAAALTWLWVARVRKHHSPNLEVVIIVVAVYGTFVLAEAIHVSGVLAVVTLGARMAADIYVDLSQKGRHVHHMWFAHHGYMCNMAIFFVSGMVCQHFIFQDSCHSDQWKRGDMWLGLVLMYLIIHLTRAFTVILFSPFLRRWGYGLTWKEGALLIFGGLRGAVGLSMGLIAEHNPYVDKRLASIIAFHTSGIVVMTLLINGSLVDEFYNKLNIYPMNPFRMTHVRKALFRVEEECQRAIRRAKADWFFRDVEFELICRCVPDLRRIVFDEAGVPQPNDIESVHHVLRALVVRSNMMADRKQREQQQLSPHSGAAAVLGSSTGNLSGAGSSLGTGASRPGGPQDANSFESIWEGKKAAPRRQDSVGCYPKSRHDFAQWLGGIVGMEAKSGEDRDELLRVKDLGLKMLEFDTASGRGQTGTYVSARPIGYFDNDEISIRILDMEGGGKIVVGVCAHTNLDSQPSAAELDLGITLGSVGLDCATGLVTSNLMGTVESATAESGALKRGSTLNVSAVPLEESHGCAIEIKDDGSSEIVAWVEFRGYSPDSIFPVIEFRPEDDNRARVRASAIRQGRASKLARFSTMLSSDDVIGSSPSIVSNKPDLLGRRNCRSSTHCGSFSGGISMDALRQAQTMLSEKVEEAFGRAPTRSNSRAGSLRHSIVGGREESVVKLKVKLSFEPQTSSAKESLSEMFQVLFNALELQYSRMHEHGNLSSGPLLRLSDAVSHAMDCANNEVNATHITLSVVEKNTHGTDNSRASLRHSRRDVKEIATSLGSVGSRVQALAARIRDGSNRRSGNGANTSTPMWSSSEDATFEPLLVEYLNIEEYITSTSCWDHFYVRLFGSTPFSKERSKIEVLWAFVQAHEKIIEQLPNLQRRFPDLHHRLVDIVAEAKNSLEILEDISPRRFQYVKSFIALRVIMTMKLMKIDQFAKEGWISVSDGETLIEAIQERLHHMEHFVPHAPNTGKKDSFARMSGGMRFSMSSRHSMNSIGSGPRDSTLSLGSLEASGSGHGSFHAARNNRSQQSARGYSMVCPTGPPPNVVIKHPSENLVMPAPAAHLGSDDDLADETDNVSVVSDFPGPKKLKSPEEDAGMSLVLGNLSSSTSQVSMSTMLKADPGFSLPGGVSDEAQRQVTPPDATAPPSQALAASTAAAAAAAAAAAGGPQQQQEREQGPPLKEAAAPTAANRAAGAFSSEQAANPSSQPSSSAASGQGRLMTRSSSH